MDKRFLGVLVGIVLVIGGIFIFSNHNKNQTGNSNDQPTNHIEGQGQDKVTLLEYGDYECPYCGQYYPIVKEVEQEYDSLIYFQFRNLPLTEIHPNAYAGARAAEAASLQGKFWQMHDALYENQDSWVSDSNPEPFFEQLATQLGLNLTEFKSDYNGVQVNAFIQGDLAAFNKTGAEEATPTFFLDGKQINPGESVASFAQFINAEIQKKTGKPSPVNPAGSTSTSAPKSTQ
jgi:protein-disulfide isomerase